MKLLVFFFLQVKRALKHPSLWAILLLIPLIAGSVAHAATDGGVLTVALACEDPADPLAQTAIRRLCERSSLVRYLSLDASQAEEAVRNGGADAAWIFEEELKNKLSRFLQGEEEPLVTVLQRAEDSSLRLSRELLHGALFPEISFELTRSFVEDTFGGEDAQIREEYENAFSTESLLQRQTVKGTALREEGNLLTAVLRGLLALVIQLAALAAAALAAEDARRRVWTSLSLPLRLFAPYLTCLAATLPCALAVSALLPFSSVFSGEPAREFFLLLLYAFAAAGFAFVFFVPFGDSLKAACAIPPLMIALAVVCPIFLSFPAPAAVQAFLAPSQYLLAAADQASLQGLVLYCPASLTLGLLFNAWRLRLSSSPRFKKPQ